MVDQLALCPCCGAPEGPPSRALPATWWRLDLPWPAPPLTANQRLHWRRHAAIVADVRATVTTLARSIGVPAGEYATVGLTWTPPDRRRRDEDNLVPTLKVCADALVDAGVVPDDTPTWMTKTMPVITAPTRPARLWLPVAVHRPPATKQKRKTA